MFNLNCIKIIWSTNDPHLINYDDIILFISLQELRREKLVEKLLKYFEKAVLKKTCREKYMCDKMPYFIRENAVFFLYSTGFHEPDCCVILTIDSDD